MHRFDEVASTQDVARERFDGGDPVVVVAGRQRWGRGRTGNAWIHAPRATATSVALRPEWPSATLGLVPLVAGMAARRTVRAEFDIEVGLKWPNDLMRGGAKIGGVLVEAESGVVVIGCGINVWWPEAPDGMAALVSDDPGRDRADSLGEAWAATVLGDLAAGPAAWDSAAYAAACVTIGQDIEWDPNGRGRAVAIAADGGLVVDTGTGSVTLRSGTVRSVRGASLGLSDAADEGAGAP